MQKKDDKVGNKTWPIKKEKRERETKIKIDSPKKTHKF